MSGASAPARPGLVDRLMRGGVGNLVVRAATLFFRFALSFYVVGQLGLSAAGIYGLVTGAIGIVPAALGWGLNYFVSREVVGMPPHAATPLVRDRLKITAASLALASLVGAIALALHAGPIGVGPIMLGLIVALLWLETFALDVYMPLIGLELAFQANIIVFVRSAVWIPFVIAAGLVWREARSLEIVFGAWVFCHGLAIALTFFFLRHWPIGQALRQPTPAPLGFVARIRRSWYIYLSDLGLVGIVFLDRFIVNSILGIRATGIYSFYGSITAALQTLIMTAVVQVALPRMIRAFRDGTPDQFRDQLRREMVKTMSYALVLSIAIFVISDAIVTLFPKRYPSAVVLLVLLLVASVVRSGSDMLNVGITSTRRDRIYAATNVVGMILTAVFSIVFLSTFGLNGAGVSALATAVILFVIRALYLRHVLRMEGRPQP